MSDNSCVCNGGDSTVDDNNTVYEKISDSCTHNSCDCDDSSTDTTFVSVNDLSVAYYNNTGKKRRTHAIYDVQFKIKPGQSMGIAGESACGKSTLGLAIMRMLSNPNDDCKNNQTSSAVAIADVSGNITYADSSLLDMESSQFDSEFRWKKISMIFQGAMNSLDPVFTVRQQFSEVLSRHGYSDDQKKIIAEAIRNVNLDVSVLDKYPHELSGGMKQRIVIAMGLLLRPMLVIADEPTTALDVLVQAQIISLLKTLKEEQQTSFILITHDLAVLSEIADVVGIMYGGQLVEFGSSHDVYNNPKHPYTQGLLQSIPTLRGDKIPGYVRGAPPILDDVPTECRFIERCPYAMEKCHTPPPRFKTDTGYVMCWLEEEKVAVEEETNF